MPENNPLLFEIYRFQLLPKSLTAQTEIFYGLENIEELKRDKNIFLAEVLDRIQLDGRRTKIAERLLYNKEPLYILQIGPERNVEIQHQDFTRERISNYPGVFVVIDNTPSSQLIYIQHNDKAFRETDIVARILDRTFNRRLAKFNLSFYINPLFDEHEFWNLVDQYSGSIKALTFEFIKPNMANISGRLPDDLRRFQEKTNAHTATLKAEAPKNGNLEIERTEIIEGLVDYSKNGGGQISLKVKGVKYQIRTSKVKKKLEIEEINSDSVEAMIEFFKALENDSI